VASDLGPLAADAEPLAQLGSRQKIVGVARAVLGELTCPAVKVMPCRRRHIVIGGSHDYCLGKTNPSSIL
jgi:hypothetical protein